MSDTHFRFDPVPEAGKFRGLDLLLDAHTDLVTASSVTEPFQVILSYDFLNTKPILLLSQGFDIVIDSRMEYPLVSMNNILIRPGHTVCKNSS